MNGFYACAVLVNKNASGYVKKMGFVIGKVCPGIKNRTGALVAAGVALVSVTFLAEVIFQLC